MTMSMRTVWTALVAVFVWMAVVGGVTADAAQPVTREQVLDIAKELVTPGGCPSLTLAECTLPTAFKIREEIAEMLAQGMEKEEIIQALVDKYGKGILGAPERKGWGLVVWSMPYVVMGTAAVALAGWLFHRRRRSAAMAVNLKRAADEEEEETIQQMLKKYL
jgi:cytochrome c-type biogenesis protein CcmH/NrfF